MPGNKRPVWAVDCETDPFEYGRVPHPFIWGVYDGYKDRYWQFEAPKLSDPADPIERESVGKIVSDQVIDFLLENEIIAYAHNGGKFDWHFITHRMDPAAPLLVINGRLAKFEIGLCEFRDSYNLMPVSLEQYQKTKIEYWKMEPAVRHWHMDEIRRYLKSDCVNLWNMLIGFEREYGRHLTQASASIKIWQKMAKRTAPKSSAYHYDYFHPYYYGGRVQCFRSGDFETQAKSIDINSAYPTAMLSKHPIGLDYIAMGPKPSVPESKYQQCFFKIRCVARGAFPYRALDKSLYFPADDIERTYHVTGWELVTALETGTVENLKILDSIHIPEQLDFQDYVNYFWNKRKEAKAEGDKGKDFYCKIFLNGLYGKFASDPRKYKTFELWTKDRLAEAVDSEKDFDFFREWLLVSEHVKQTEYRFYNLATAASITGYVRAMLWDAICKTETTFYCDTDSITAENFSGLPMGKELGEWQVEGEYDRVVICGKKMYAFHHKGQPLEDVNDRDESRKRWKKATKGVNLRAEHLIKIASGEAINFKPIVPTFTVHKSEPRFVSRVVKLTAADITVVPKHKDPEYA